MKVSEVFVFFRNLSGIPLLLCWVFVAQHTTFSFFSCLTQNTIDECDISTDLANIERWP